MPRVVELAGGVGGAKLADGLLAELGSRADRRRQHRRRPRAARPRDLARPRHGRLHARRPRRRRARLGARRRDLDRHGRARRARRRDLVPARRPRPRDPPRGERTGFATGARPTDGRARARRTRSASPATILPMTDDQVRTEVRTDDGWLDFQEYFVHRHQAPEVHEVRFAGVERGTATPEVLAALAAAELIVIAPSNPIVSIGPILAVPGMREALDRARARAASRSSPSAGSSAAARSRARPTGCSRRSGTSPAHAASPRLYAGSPTGSCSTTSTRDSEPAIEALGLRDAGHRHDHDRRCSARPAGRPCSRSPLARAGPIVSAVRPRPTRDRRAIIPVATLEGAKSRLGGPLDAEERGDLVEPAPDAGPSPPRSQPPASPTTLVVSRDRGGPRPRPAAPGARPLRQTLDGA